MVDYLLRTTVFSEMRGTWSLILLLSCPPIVPTP